MQNTPFLKAITSALAKGPMSQKAQDQRDDAHKVETATDAKDVFVFHSEVAVERGSGGWTPPEGGWTGGNGGWTPPEGGWGGGGWSPPEGGWGGGGGWTPPEDGWGGGGGWTPPEDGWGGDWSPPNGGWGGGDWSPDWLLPVEVTIMVNGIERTFGITMPKDFDPAQLYAGIMTFHGGGESGTDPVTMAGLADWSDYDSPPQFIEIYPVGMGDTWGWDPNDDPFNDLEFVAALIDELITNWNLDPEALFAAGISAGGNMVQRLALEMPEFFAGYGVVVSSLTDAMVAEATASQVDEPMIIFHGTDDAVVPYEGIDGWQGQPVLYSAEETAEFWAEHNDTEMGEFIELPDSTDDGTTVLYRTSVDGSVAHYVVVGGDHSWPGSIETSAQDIDASQLIVEFFSDYGLY